MSRPRRARPLVAFTAPPHFPELHDDWPLVRAALDDVGVDGVPVVWSDPSVEWSAFDLIVANGAWDNIHRVDEFLAWVDARARAGDPTVNSPATLRWNLDKRYLRVLEDAGVATVPTVWVEPEAAAEGAVPAIPSGEVVVKPAVSGGGHRTARYEPHERDAMHIHLRELIEAGRAAMIQPYQPAVDTEGETALVFLAGAYSHAIHKAPMIRRGTGPLEHLIDNQVTSAAPPPSPAQLDLGRQALAVAERLLGPTTYARVDTVTRTDGAPAVLELELLDPVLFFVHQPAATATFAAVIKDRLAGGP